MSDKFVRYDKPESNQDFFNKAWEWLVVENRPTCANNLGCVYREHDEGGISKINGHSCVIGAFIPDNYYTQSFEDQSITLLINKFSFIANLFENVSSELINEIQIVHDLVNDDRKLLMTKIAASFELTIPKAKFLL